MDILSEGENVLVLNDGDATGILNKRA